MSIDNQVTDLDDELAVVSAQLRDSDGTCSGSHAEFFGAIESNPGTGYTVWADKEAPAARRFRWRPYSETEVRELLSELRTGADTKESAR